jgi:hypothetical protein
MVPQRFVRQVSSMSSGVKSPKRAFEATRRAGVIDPTVDNREFRSGIRHERRSLARRGHIARHAMHLASGRLDSKPPKRCFETVMVTSADDHTVSGEQEHPCHRQAKPRRSPGHHHAQRAWRNILARPHAVSHLENINKSVCPLPEPRRDPSL